MDTDNFNSSDSLIKIRGDFLSEREADAAVGKISPYCHNIKILYNGGANSGYDSSASGHGGYGGYNGYLEDFEPAFYDYSIMGGITAGWSLNPYSSYNFQHTRSYNYLSSLGIGRNAGKTILEADVSQDKYELVKERLYSLGAVSVN